MIPITFTPLYVLSTPHGGCDNVKVIAKAPTRHLVVLPIH